MAAEGLEGIIAHFAPHKVREHTSSAAAEDLLLKVSQLTASEQSL